MPTYDYRCTRCEHRFEALQSIIAAALTDCPVCGQPALQRLIGPGAGVIFRGSGFYETDYKRASSGGKSDAKGDGGAKSEPAKSDAPKSDKSEAPKSDAPKAEPSKPPATSNE